MNHTAVPTKRQQEFLDWEFGVFFHFGIRTFYEGHRDWDGKEMPLSGFFPTDLDCEDWIKTSKKAGAKYAILVCKHHDGFANWPSAYTEYSVKNTPWKDGQGDVVREFTDACRKYDMKVGLYYSPAEFGFNERTDEEYDDYFINQISELLTNYGKIDYLWFDGCGSEDHEYNQERIVKELRRMQPDMLIFNMWDPDTRWVGNEDGVAPSPNFNYVEDLSFSVQTDRRDTLSTRSYLPAECDCKMRQENWFYSDFDEDTVKSVDELMGLYYYSVGRGANLLLNIGPDRRGRLPEKDKARLLAFGKEVRRRFQNPLPVTVSQEGNCLICDFDGITAVNHIVLAENLLAGKELDGFEIIAYEYAQPPVVLYHGRTVGHKSICRFETMLVKKLVIRFQEENPQITSVKCYYVQ